MTYLSSRIFVLVLWCCSMLVLAPVAPLREDTRDPHRPTYHFLPPANWMNDTMGIWWKGEYHIFYLYNPDAPTWRQAKEWGHAFGADLVHWKHLPSALGPVPGSPESLCCQTGSLTVNDGVPVAFYTCAPGTCMATSTDDLRSWRRHPENPVISGPPPELDVFGFRDPFVFRRDNTWYLLQGSGIRGSGGTILLYESKDLRSWRYVHPLLPGLGNEDEVWEVPELFPLDAKDVLIYSPTTESRFTRYLIGTFCDRQFRPASRGKLDLGGYLYAATTFRDPNGRQIMVAWIKEGRSKEAVLKAGWSGILSVPRVLSLGREGQLHFQPVTELEMLRRGHRAFSNLKLIPGANDVLAGVEGDALDIVAEFDPGSAARFGLKVLSSPDREEETSVYYDRPSSRFLMDTTRSSHSSDVDKKILGDSLKWIPGQRFRLRILVDRSVVEAFGDDRAAIAGRVYPKRSGSFGVRLLVEGGEATLRSLDVWQMESIW